VDSPADVVRRFYTCWNADDLDGVLETFDEDAEFRPIMAPLLTREVYRGHADIAHWFTELRERWTEFKVDVERVDEVEHGVVAIIRLVATDGDGRQLDARIANVFALRDGRISVLVGRDAGETLEALEAELGGR
jgi:ketosteroid isomerase-like protein